MERTKKRGNNRGGLKCANLKAEQHQRPDPCPTRRQQNAGWWRLCMRSNIDMANEIARRTTSWFKASTNERTGLVLDRNNRKGMAATTAGTGFAIICYAIAADQGWGVTRADARAYTLKLLRFLNGAPQGTEPHGNSGHQGFFYHFLDPDTGLRTWNSELSSIDTALLMAGVLFARNYFNWVHNDEAEIRRLATELYERVRWSWMLKSDGSISMAWNPESGLYDSSYMGYCEDLVLYVLALGSQNHAIPDDSWEKAVLGETNRFIVGKLNGKGPVFVRGPGMPAFFEQYNNLVPFRGIQDRVCRELGFDYYSNGIISTKAQYRYAVENVGRWEGYGKKLFALTACDGAADSKSIALGAKGIIDGSGLLDLGFNLYTSPARGWHRYLCLANLTRKIQPDASRQIMVNGEEVKVIRGVERHFRSYSERGITGFDDGHIAPTAAIGSLMFAPHLVLPMMRHLLTHYPEVIDEHGFTDSFNLTYDWPDIWVDRDPSGYLEHLSIDQGPIVIGIDRWLRPGWYEQIMRSDPAIQLGLKRAGFGGDWWLD